MSYSITPSQLKGQIGLVNRLKYGCSILYYTTKKEYTNQL